MITDDERMEEFKERLQSKRRHRRTVRVRDIQLLFDLKSRIFDFYYIADLRGRRLPRRLLVKGDQRK